MSLSPLLLLIAVALDAMEVSIVNAMVVAILGTMKTVLARNKVLERLSLLLVILVMVTTFVMGLWGWRGTLG